MRRHIVKNKRQAIERIREIQCGGYDRNEMFEEIPFGSLAATLWDDTKFAYGMEYGAIAEIMRVFGIKEKDLNGEQ